MEVHQAFSKECSCIEIVRVTLGQLSHCVRVFRIQLPQIGLEVGRVALGQSLDVVSLALRCAGCQRQSLLCRLVRGFFMRWIDVKVDARTQRQCDTPKDHRGLWIQLCCPPECTRGFLVIESENEGESLIEETLGLGAFAGNCVVMLPQPGHYG